MHTYFQLDRNLTNACKIMVQFCSNPPDDHFRQGIGQLGELTIYKQAFTVVPTMDFLVLL